MAIDLMPGFGAFTQSSSVTYSTLDPANKGTPSVLSNGDMTASSSAIDWGTVRGTLSRSAGAYYCEFHITALNPGDNDWFVGFVDGSASMGSILGESSQGCGFRANERRRAGGSVENSIGTWTPAEDDVLMLAYDAASGNVWFGRNGTWNGSVTPSTGSNSGRLWYVAASTALYPTCATYATTTQITFVNATANFAYSPPAGFSEWG
jgi:hypothetical protein